VDGHRCLSSPEGGATFKIRELLHFDRKKIGLGVVNPRTETLESTEEIRAAICRALQHYSPDRIFLNPDCGFETFSNRPMNSEAVAIEKLRAMSAVARALRG
jgi:5-methyltetrahydropteroyltriglutamate--homocysteine methyltransferase